MFYAKIDLMIRYLSFAFLLVLAFTNPLRAAVIFSINSDWKYLKGLAEASDPVAAWRTVSFDHFSAQCLAWLSR